MASVSPVRFVPLCWEDSIKKEETEAEEFIPSGYYKISHPGVEGCIIAGFQKGKSSRMGKSFLLNLFLGYSREVGCEVHSVLLRKYKFHEVACHMLADEGAKQDYQRLLNPVSKKHFGSTESTWPHYKMTNYEEQNPSSSKYPAPSKFSGSIAKDSVAARKRPREWHTVAVDPGGSEVQVPGAKIVFPRGAVKKKEHFRFQINYQQSEEGPGRIRITPELSCRPSKEFLKNVRIELRTWCLSSPKIEIICNREDGTNDHEHVTIDNHEGHKVVFETSHFTRFRVTAKMSNARRGAFALRWILYRKFQQYHAMFLLCDRHEMLEKASGLKQDGFHIVQMANPVVIKACDVIKISLSSAAYKVRPGKAEFTLDSDLLAKRRRVLSFEVESAPEGTIQELDCKFYVNGKGQDYYPINHMVAERGPSVGKRARRMQTASKKEDSSCDDSNGEKCSQQK